MYAQVKWNFYVNSSDLELKIMSKNLYVLQMVAQAKLMSLLKQQNLKSSRAPLNETW